MRFLKRIFAWWDSATIGTFWTTWTQGQEVGKDQFGNRYYQNKDSSRRWVIYNGTVEASRVPPDWHGWLHHTVDTPPTAETVTPRSWWKPHRPNLTGTSAAQRPSGSTLAQIRRPKATGDYKAWNPGR